MTSAVLQAAEASVFAPPWDELDDDALLAHWRSPRPVQVDLVVDADECSPAHMAALLQGRFDFHGESHHLGRHPDWLHNPSADVEWHILLHKFYYAAGLARDWQASGDLRHVQRFTELVSGWMDQVPPGFIAADVTGRRVQNWLYALRGLLHHGNVHQAPLDGAFLRRLLLSLHEQVEHLCANLTPKRNHRTLELYAIFLAGVCLPEMARAAHWRHFALQHTLANLQADLLPDGVHCELSTDYHHLALRNWLHVRTLAVRNGVALPPAMDRLLQRALAFSLHVHRPDGIVPALSDGDARSFLPLLAQAAQLYGRDDMRWVASRGAQGRAPARTVAHFADSGYTVVRSGWGQGPHDFADAQHLVFDCGPLGEGNHGHLDCLSFELYAHGRPLLVDPGRCTYSEAGDVNWRVHFRGTAAHNTVCVDGRHQTRYVPKALKEASRHAPGSVRHRIGGPAPDATLLEAASAPGLVLLHGRAASHEYDAVHERVIAFLGGRLWVVSDSLRAPGEHHYVLNFQLSDDAQGRVQVQAGPLLQLHSPGLTLLQPQPAGMDSGLADGWVSTRYGHRQPAPRLRSALRGRDVDIDTVLQPWAQQAAALQLQALAVAGGTRPLQVLRLVQGDGVDTWFHARGDRAPAWAWDGVRFQGRWLHLRHDAQGTLRSASSHAGAQLHVDGQRVALHTATDEAVA